MQRRERICACGKVEFTFTRTDTCHDCHWAAKRTVGIARELAHLSSLYSEIDGPFLDQKTPHRHWTFTHECGTRQTWRYGNILKQLKLRPDKVPCSACGGKERMSKALAAFVEKYGIKDIEVWKRYSQKVRGLTEVVYKLNIQTINPLGHKRTRGSTGWHLDHRKPIIQSFLDGDRPEFAARLENLQMMEAFANLSKGRNMSQ